MRIRGAFLGILLLLALPVVFAKAPLAQCEDRGTEYSRSNCYLGEAISRFDWEYCSFIKYSVAEKMDCFVGVALRKMNSSLCESPETRSAKGQCNEAYALLEDDTSLCDLAGDYKGHCYYSLANKLEDVSLCEKAEAHRPRCLHEAALRLKDPQYCEEADNVDECYIAVAQETEDTELCRLAIGHEVECLGCTDDEYVEDNTCKKLQCRGDQELGKHACVDLNCPEHYTARKHECIPDFLCSDTDGDTKLREEWNLEKKGTCNAPAGEVGTDWCQDQWHLMEYVCTSEEECWPQVMSCQDYCEEANHLSGKCFDGRCGCYDTAAELCDYTEGWQERYVCYRREGVGPLGSLLRFGLIQFLLVLVGGALVGILYKTGILYRAWEGIQKTITEIWKYVVQLQTKMQEGTDAQGRFIRGLLMGAAGGFALNLLLDHLLSNSLILFLLPLLLIVLAGHRAKVKKTEIAGGISWGYTLITAVLIPLYLPLIALGLFNYGLKDLKWLQSLAHERRRLGSTLVVILIAGFALSTLWQETRIDYNYNWQVHVLVVNRSESSLKRFFSADILTIEMEKILAGIPKSEYRRPTLGAPYDRSFLNGFTVELTERGLEALNEGGYDRSEYVTSLSYDSINRPLGQSIPLIPGSLRHCWTDKDCVPVTEGYCGCSSGGRNTIINRKYLYTWSMRDLPFFFGGFCLQVISNHWTCWAEPKCVDRTCTLIEQPRPW